MRTADETPAVKRVEHGMFGTRFYHCYAAIKQRCYNPQATSYSRYGAKGIQCEWESFMDFKRDMYESYLVHVKEYGERQTTIDRLDNLKNYSKQNCRWATYKEQGNNHSRIHFLTFNGKRQSITQWASELGIRKELIATRISRGWPVENALSKNKFHRFKSGKTI